MPDRRLVERRPHRLREFVDHPYNTFATELPPSRTIAHDTATGEGQEVELPRHHQVVDVSADGRTFLTFQKVRVKSGWSGLPRLAHGSDDEPFAGAADVFPETFHPDGKRVFAARLPDNGDPEPLLVELSTGKETRLGWLAKVKEQVGESPYRWHLSPNRSRVVAMWQREVKKPADWTPAGPCVVRCIGVCDLDGGNFKVIYNPEPKTTAEWEASNVSGFAWR